MTDPRIAALAEALRPHQWSDDGPVIAMSGTAEEVAAAILAALDAAGWAVTNDPSILLVLKERLAYRDQAEQADAEIIRLMNEHGQQRVEIARLRRMLMDRDISPDIVHEWSEEKP